MQLTTACGSKKCMKLNQELKDLDYSKFRKSKVLNFIPTRAAQYIRWCQNVMFSDEIPCRQF